MTWYRPYIVSAISPKGTLIETREYILFRHARKRYKMWCGDYSPKQATIVVWRQGEWGTNEFILYRPSVDSDQLVGKGV